MRENPPAGVAFDLLSLLARAPHPMTIVDLQSELGGHPNRFRAPLERLVEEGFVSETTAAAKGRGRPARAYTATPVGAQVVQQHPGLQVHVALVEAVAASLRELPDPAAAARAMGRSWGERLGQADLVPALAAQGFSPVVNGEHVVLRTCPLLDAARRDPVVVCSMHQGLLDAIGPGDLTLVPFGSPEGCVVQPAGPADGPAGREISHELPSQMQGG